MQRNKWEDWIDWADDADLEVAWVPLSEESRQKFDLSKAWQFFVKQDGLPYGHRT